MKMQEIIDEFNSHSVVICAPCVAISSTNFKIIKTECIFDMHKQSNPEDHDAFYSVCSSAKLFYYKNNLEDMIWESGIKIFSRDESKEKNSIYKEITNFKSQDWDVIGADISNGDLFLKLENGVFFLTHEIFYENPSEKDCIYIAKSLEDFLQEILNNPINYLKVGWRYVDNNIMNQWCPVKVL